MENNKFTMINNTYIKGTDEVLTPQELTIFTLIAMHQSINNQYIFTINGILKLLNVTNNNNRKQQQIKSLLNKLIEYEELFIYSTTVEDNKYLIEDIKNIDKNTLIYASNTSESETFTLLYDYEILRILEYSKHNRIDLYSLMNLYIYIVSHINCNDKDEYYNLCYISHERIIDDLGISENSIIKYIDILIQLNILRCDYAGYKETAKGQIKNGVMHYCRVEHEQLLIEKLNEIRSKKGFIKLNNKSKDKSNIKKSLKQQLNNLNKKIENNTITEVEKVSYKLIKEEYKKLKIKEDKQA